MDIETFDKFSVQFKSQLSQLEVNEKAMQVAAHSHSLADTAYLSECATQVSTEKHLQKIAHDIRALGSYYNCLCDSIGMQHEQFDSLD